MTLVLPDPPKTNLRSAHYSPYAGYNPRIGAYQVVGSPLVEGAVEAFVSSRAAGGRGEVALDIETTGVGAGNWWNITCVTAAFWTPNGVVTALLNPMRETPHRGLLRKVVDNAEKLIFHNSSFDIPPMVAHRLLTFDDVNKVWDTLVLARMLRTTDRAGRSLEQLAMRYKLTPDDGITMANVMTAAGFRSSRDGYANMDIDYGTYRDGATSDTAITLRLYDELLATVRAKHDGMRGNPATLPGAESVDALIAGVQRVNQIALRRSASGYKVDRDYRQAYEKALVYDKDRNPVCDSAGNHLNVEEQVRLASIGLTAAYLIPGRGDLLIEHLHTQGELPSDWPRTPTGKLKADKEALERLSSMGHPLTQAHRIVADHHKISGYLDKVLENSTDTGRLHPQIAILGAAASGRMSVSGVELHQFPGIARPVLLADHDPGFSSVDWSSIEPVTMALCAGDRKLLDPFNAGADLYIPVARQAGLIPADVDDATAAEHSGRKVAKVVLLAAMYGQGGKSLAANLTAALKRTVEVGEAYDLRRSVQDAMPDSFAFMDRISEFAERYGAVSTISGRVLDEDAEYLYRAVNHFCVTPDTPILTADLRHVRADSVRVGDELVGFDEHSPSPHGRGGGKRRFRTAVVKNVNFVMKPSVAVYTSDGRVTVCSSDHKWFVRHPGNQPRLTWVEAGDLTPEHQMMSVGVWDADTSRDAGYLAGLFDGEGSMQTRASGSSCSQITFHQKPGNGVMEEFRGAMDRLGLSYTFIPKSPNNTSPCDGVRVSGLSRMMRLTGMIRPHRMVSRTKDIFDGADLYGEKTMESTPYVVQVKPVGVRKLVAIETSTHTFVANGFLSHNCQGSAADLLYEATLEIDRRGLSDHVHLWMHDELVVSTSVQAEIENAMQTPPQALRRWARVPDIVLRTDAKALGMHWDEA